MESARIVGALARYTGDFSLADDLAQEALAEALVSWSVDGVPPGEDADRHIATPAAWSESTPAAPFNSTRSPRPGAGREE